MLAYDVIEGTANDQVIMLMHGLGDSRHGWKPIVQELNLTAPTWCMVEAPIPYGMGFSWFCIPGFTDEYSDWDDFRKEQRQSRDLLEATVQSILERFAIPPERLVIIGFSQGCLMALDHVLRADRAYAGVVAMSGWMAYEEEYPQAYGSALPQQRILWTHGRMDPVRNIETTRAQADKAIASGLPIDWREYDAEHGMNMEQLIELRDWLTEALA